MILLAVALAPLAEAETRVGGEISTSTTWTLAGSPYVVDGSVYVRGSGAPVLTIEPGVVVKVGNSLLISAGDGGAGSLRAIGTAEKPITFTTVGAVAPDRWRGLLLMAGSGGSRLENVIVEGGGWGNNAGITVTGSAPVLQNVTVRTSSDRGIRVGAGGAPEIRDSTVTGTTGGVGIEIGAGARAKLLRVAIRQCATHGLLVGTAGEAELTDVEISGNGGGAITVQPGAQLTGLTGMTLTGNGQDGVRHLGGNVAVAETWKSFGYPYYVVDSYLYVRGAGAPVLTIEPGVVVKAGNGHLISAGEGAAGSLRAIGTAEKPITFTTSGAVAPDWWRGLLLMAGSGGSRLENVIVEGGGWGNNAGITVTGSAPVLQNVTVRTSRDRGIRVEAGGAPEIRDSTVTGTTGGVGIEIGAGATAKLLRVAIRQCSMHGLLVGTVAEAELTDVEISGNGGGAIAVQPGAQLAGLTGVMLTGNGQNGVRHLGGNVAAAETWKSFGYPYYVVDTYLYVRGAAAPVLTIEPGVVVKMGNGHLISAGDGGAGSLRAIGTADKPITFTTSGAVAPDWWRGLLLMAGSGGSRLENVIVEGGGWGRNAGITVTGSAPVLQSVTVRTSRERGIRVEAGGAPEITDSTVTGITGGEGVGIRLSAGSAARIERTSASGNSGAGILNEGSRSSLRFVTLAGNGSEGLRSTSGELVLRDGIVTGQTVPVRNSDPQSRVVDARQQWFGSADGPSGLAGRVEYDPWLGALPTPAFAVTSLEASTRAFPPGTSSVRFDIALPSIASWVLRFLAPDGSEARRFEGTGRSATVTWDGTGAAGAVLADGEYRVRLEATEESTGSVAAPLVGRLSLDSSLPVSVLTAPAGGVRARVGDEVAILGSAGGTGFQTYVLEAGAGDFPASWAVVDRGVLPVANGTLGSFTTALLEPGRYTLRLSVTGTAGKVAATTTRIELFEEGECR